MGCGAVRCAAVWCGAVRYCAVWCGGVRCGVVQCGAVQCKLLQFTAVLFTSVLFASVLSTFVLFTPFQPTSVQCNTVENDQLVPCKYTASGGSPATAVPNARPQDHSSLKAHLSEVWPRVWAHHGLVLCGCYDSFRALIPTSQAIYHNKQR